MGDIKNRRVCHVVPAQHKRRINQNQEHKNLIVMLFSTVAVLLPNWKGLDIELFENH